MLQTYRLRLQKMLSMASFFAHFAAAGSGRAPHRQVRHEGHTTKSTGCRTTQLGPSNPGIKIFFVDIDRGCLPEPLLKVTEEVPVGKHGRHILKNIL